MADDPTKDAGASEEEKPKEGAEEEQKPSEEGEQGPAEEGGEKAEGEEGKEEEGDKKPPAKPAEEEEPPVRQSAKDFIIKRKEKKIKKLEEKGDEEDEDDEVTPEGEKAIQKVVKEQLEPILQGQRSTSDKAELLQVFAEYPASKEMEKDIVRYMDHPAYKDVSVEFIYLGLAAKKGKFQAMKDSADDKAKKSGMGGAGKRKSELAEIPDVSNFTEEQMDALALKAKTGQFGT